MSNSHLQADPASYNSLLTLIGSAESNDNYNAYFGNPDNTSLRLTDMSISEVMQWQKEYIRNGSPSSAVGRYQIINTTLQDLQEEMNLDPDQPFNEQVQDEMAAHLLKRRGVEQYLNKQISSEEFAANLAKEWAALPKVSGTNPDESYYAGDGLNRSRVTRSQVLDAIDPITAK